MERIEVEPRGSDREQDQTGKIASRASGGMIGVMKSDTNDSENNSSSCIRGM